MFKVCTMFVYGYNSLSHVIEPFIVPPWVITMKQLFPYQLLWETIGKCYILDLSSSTYSKKDIGISEGMVLMSHLTPPDLIIDVM